MRALVCLYTCPKDQEQQSALEATRLWAWLGNQPGFEVVEVLANPTLATAQHSPGRMEVPAPEDYTALSLKTHRMVLGALERPFDVLLKVDATLARYETKAHRKSAEMLARLSPEAVLEALQQPGFFQRDYNGIVQQRAGRAGFERWLATKGLEADWKRVFDGDEMSPPYFLGKCYALSRSFCEFIAAHGAAMAEEHHRFLAGSEDLMVGRLYADWLTGASA